MYLCIGDKYVDPPRNMFRQKPKGQAEPKPFNIKLQPINAEDGYFSKLTYNAGPYKEGYLYITSQPLDKRQKGFGSKDASRRDEFSSEIRCSQYREGIKKELALSKKFLESSLPRADSAPETSSHASTWSGTTRGGVHQYDIGRTQVTPFDPKSTRDQYYKLAVHSDKVLGTMRPISTDIGDVANSIPYKPPKYGTASLVKNFYDQSHLKVRGVAGNV